MTVPRNLLRLISLLTPRSASLSLMVMRQENDQLLDGGDLGIERKLFYREFIARFGHHVSLSACFDRSPRNSSYLSCPFAVLSFSSLH